jgi:hypothetical protein
LSLFIPAIHAIRASCLKSNCHPNAAGRRSGCLKFDQSPPCLDYEEIPGCARPQAQQLKIVAHASTLPEDSTCHHQPRGQRDRKWAHHLARELTSIPTGEGNKSLGRVKPRGLNFFKARALPNITALPCNVSADMRNAYRVLLTRARQGMVVFIPPVDSGHPTRNPQFYDSTLAYSQRLAFRRWALAS